MDNWLSKVSKLEVQLSWTQTIKEIDRLVKFGALLKPQD